MFNWLRNLFRKKTTPAPMPTPVPTQPKEWPLKGLTVVAYNQGQEWEIEEFLRKTPKIKSEYYPIYQKVSDKTGAPVWWIAAIHYREASFNFKSFLGNGDPLDKMTTHVPRGLGPFKSWEEGAIAAIQHEEFDNKWDTQSCITKAIAYNGNGYTRRGILSPYAYAATNFQQQGLYIADGRFDSGVWDDRLGVVAIGRLLGEI